MPGCAAVGKSILHDQANGGEDDTMGVTSAGQRQIGHVRVEAFLALGAVVLRVSDVQIDRSFRPGVSQIMQLAVHPSVPIGSMTADRT
jgi:hypothetical protein